MNLSEPSSIKYDAFPFNDLKDKGFESALKYSLDKASLLITEAKKSIKNPTYQSSIENIDLAIEALNRSVLPLLYLRSLRESDTILGIIKEHLPVLTKFKFELTIDEELYELVKKISASKNLTKDQRASIDLIHKEFIENGITLRKEERAEYKSLVESIDVFQTKYLENLQKDESEINLTVEDEDQIIGIPEPVLNSAKKRAEDQSVAGWIFSIKDSEYIPAIKNANNREFRKNLFSKRSSLCNSGTYNNQEICFKLLNSRLQKAQLMGFKNHTEFKLSHNENCSPEEILSILEDFRTQCSPLALAELEELKSQEKSIQSLKEWDVHYLKNRTNKPSTNNAEITFYKDNLVNGIFTTLEKIFKISFIEDDEIPSYVTKNVQTFRVESCDKEVIGLLYLDLFSRAKKRSGNWMAPMKEKASYSNRDVIPQVVVSTNILEENINKINLFEASRILHEFGHAIHAILPASKLPRLNSVFNCPMSILELPSKLLENLLKVPEVLSYFLGNEASSEEIESASKVNQNPYFDIIQTSNAIYDLKLHMLTDLSVLNDWEKFEKENLRTDLQNNSFPSCIAATH